MFLSFFNQTGNWNPQLFRELKGRLTFRNVAIAATLSTFTQILVIISFWLQLPVTPPMGADTHSITHKYCTGSHHSDYYSEYDCVRDTLGSFAINWQHWWQDIFKALGWILPLALLLGGVYMLISDMAKEERRGTLNFIRLSPQSSQSILIGKMLGVPIVLYIAIALAFPLHLYSAINGAVPLGVVIGYDLMLIAFCTCFYSAALLYALLGKSQPELGMVLASVLAFPYWVMLQFFFSASMTNNPALDLRWFYLNIGENLAELYSFCLFTITGINYGIWEILNRRFRNPNATLIGKLQSYLLVTSCQLWMLGFALYGLDLNYASLFLGFTALFFLNPLGFLILIATLSPQRQPLQDWARYRQSKVTPGKGFWNWSILQDLIVGEKSPALVAIALNLAITAIIWMPWIVLLPPNTHGLLEPGKIQRMLACLLTLNLILICAAIAQLILLMKARKPQLWAAGAVGAILGVPLIAIAGLSLTPETYPALWLISAIPVVAVKYASLTTICLTILAQWSALTLFSLQLTRQLHKAGESTSKALLAS